MGHDKPEDKKRRAQIHISLVAEKVMIVFKAPISKNEPTAENVLCFISISIFFFNKCIMFKFLRRNRKTKSKDYFKRDKLLDTVCFFFLTCLLSTPTYIHISFLNRPFLLTSDLLLSLLLPWKVQI